MLVEDFNVIRQKKGMSFYGYLAKESGKIKKTDELTMSGFSRLLVAPELNVPGSYLESKSGYYKKKKK